MHTKSLMSLSAILMAAAGVLVSFMPQEILARYGASPDGRAVLLLQLVGALYLGFAVLNWMARSNLIGGIYSRPVALGNFLHFGVMAIALLKAVIGGSLRAREIVVATILYSALAAWFGLVLFTSPGQNKQG